MSNKRIPELDPKTTKSGSMEVPVYDYATDTTYRMALDILVPIDEVQPDAWDETVNYAEGDIVSFEDQAYISLDDDNFGNIPSSSPGSWTPVDTQQGSAIAPWAAGLYTGENTIVLYEIGGELNLYKLTVETPYNSSDFETELGNGDWQIIGGGGGGGGFGGEINADQFTWSVSGGGEIYGYIFGSETYDTFNQASPLPRNTKALKRFTVEVQGGGTDRVLGLRQVGGNISEGYINVTELLFDDYFFRLSNMQTTDSLTPGSGTKSFIYADGNDLQLVYSSWDETDIFTRFNLVSGVYEDPYNLRGLKYDADYSANFTDRSLIDKAYAAGFLAGMAIPAPTASEDGMSIRYNHGTTSWEYFTP